jgi:hypothetical protein
MKRFTQCVHCKKNAPLRANSSGRLLPSGLYQKRACIRSQLRVVRSQGRVSAGGAARRQRRECAGPDGGSADRRSGRQALRPGQDLTVAMTIQGAYFGTPAANFHRSWPCHRPRTALPRPRVSRGGALSDDMSPISLVRRERKERPRCVSAEFWSFSTWTRGPPGDLPGPPAPGRDRLADAAPRPGRADSRSRRLRCALGHGRAAGRLGGR